MEKLPGSLSLEESLFWRMALDSSVIDHNIFLKLSLVGKHFLKELGIRGDLRNDIQKWDIDLQFLEYLQKFSKFGLKFGLNKPLRERYNAQSA